MYERNRTGFEETKDYPIDINGVIAGRYQVSLSPAAVERKRNNLKGFKDLYLKARAKIWP